jgi:hypothetical protein
MALLKATAKNTFLQLLYPKLRLAAYLKGLSVQAALHGVKWWK